jgi:hypothetical protein
MARQSTLDLLERSQKEELIQVADAAVVTRPVGRNKPQTEQLHSMTGAGALWWQLLGPVIRVDLLRAITAVSPGSGDALVSHRGPTCGTPTTSRHTGDKGETPMTASTEATQSAQPERPGLTDGNSSEFTVFCKIKPGHADALREVLAAAEANLARGPQREIGTLHDTRSLILDNDTYMFNSRFDGSWDTYIDDFGTTKVGEIFDKLFSHTEGFPGIKDPNVKEWFVSQQVPALHFTTSYPDLTVQQIWKDQRMNEAFQEVLDAPEFRALLDNPASAELRATPSFQKLLDEAAG